MPGSAQNPTLEVPTFKCISLAMGNKTQIRLSLVQGWPGAPCWLSVSTFGLF